MSTQKSSTTDLPAKDSSTIAPAPTPPPRPSTEYPTPPNLPSLKKDTNLWYKLHILLYDLRHFSHPSPSHSRLEKLTDPYYLGAPYFNPLEADKIKTLHVAGDITLSTLIEETLSERLARRNKKREQSGDYRVCAAHDVAPILEKALGIRPKDLEKDRGFLEMMAARGLHLEPGEEWSGVGVQRKTIRDRSGRKKGKG